MPMTRENSRQPQPVRHDLADPRSMAAPTHGVVRKTILNDTRSTRSRPA
jgi:hypothetical protein